METVNTLKISVTNREENTKEIGSKLVCCKLGTALS